MSKILYAPGIEVVSGALAKIQKKSNHAWDQNMVLATHREAATMNPKCSRLYLRKVNQLPWQPGKLISLDVRDLRIKFATKAKAVAARKTDLLNLTKDQINFRALRDEYKQKTGYGSTFKAFLWAGAEKYWNDTNVQWPANDGISLTYQEFADAMNYAREHAN